MHALASTLTARQLATEEHVTSTNYSSISSDKGAFHSNFAYALHTSITPCFWRDTYLRCAGCKQTLWKFDSVPAGIHCLSMPTKSLLHVVKVQHSHRLHALHKSGTGCDAAQSCRPT